MRAVAGWHGHCFTPGVRRKAMLTYLMIGVLALLVLLSMAGDFASYSGKRFL